MEDEALVSLGYRDAVGFQDDILHRFPCGKRQHNTMRKRLMLAEVAFARGKLTASVLCVTCCGALCPLALILPMNTYCRAAWPIVCSASLILSRPCLAACKLPHQLT